jgi:hypothetical protein
MEHDKPSGVAAAQAAATDIGYAMQTVENLGFYPRTLPKGYKMTITPQPWIPVSERLPDDGKEVLVSVDENCDDCGLHVCVFDGEAWRRSEAGYIKWKTFHFGVTHWMPLPEPPEVK